MMNSTTSPLTSQKRQTGAALVTSLVILLVLTLLGVAAMSGSSLEELMVGNLRDQTIALDAAESALREGERQIESWGAIRPTAATSIATTSSVYQKDIFFSAPGEDFNDHVFDTAVWGTDSNPSPAQSYAGGNLGTSQPPRFIIEELGDIGGSADYRNNINRSAITLYRVTARATGLSPNSVILLQTTYGKRY